MPFECGIFVHKGKHFLAATHPATTVLLYYSYILPKLPRFLHHKTFSPTPEYVWLCICCAFNRFGALVDLWKLYKWKCDFDSTLRLQSRMCFLYGVFSFVAVSLSVYMCVSYGFPINWAHYFIVWFFFRSFCIRDFHVSLNWIHFRFARPTESVCVHACFANSLKIFKRKGKLWKIKIKCQANSCTRPGLRQVKWQKQKHKSKTQKRKHVSKININFYMNKYIFGVRAAVPPIRQ